MLRWNTFSEEDLRTWPPAETEVLWAIDPDDPWFIYGTVVRVGLIARIQTGDTVQDFIGTHWAVVNSP